MSSELGCALFSPFTSLRGPPDCRSPPPCLRATVARKHCCRKGGLGLDAARTRGAEKRRARGLARSASCELTHRGCLSAESEANEASSAMGPRDRCTEPGHKQSCGLFVPGEGPGLWPGPQGSRRAAPTAEHKRRSQAKPAFAWGTSKQASEKHRTDRRTNDVPQRAGSSYPALVLDRLITAGSPQLSCLNCKNLGAPARWSH